MDVPETRISRFESHDYPRDRGIVIDRRGAEREEQLRIDLAAIVAGRCNGAYFTVSDHDSFWFITDPSARSISHSFTHTNLSLFLVFRSEKSVNDPTIFRLTVSVAQRYATISVISWSRTIYRETAIEIASDRPSRSACLIGVVAPIGNIRTSLEIDQRDSPSRPLMETTARQWWVNTTVLIIIIIYFLFFF